MKSVVVWLLFMCAPSISTKYASHLDNGTKSNILTTQTEDNMLLLFRGNLKSENLKTDYYPGYYGEMSDRIKQVESRSVQEVWRRDPNVHVEGITYLKLRGAFASYSQLEKDMQCDVVYKPQCQNVSDTPDRYINLQPTLANVYDNRVITGVQLVKKNHVVHIIIQEGKLLPYGHIDENSLSWTSPNEKTAYCHVIGKDSKTIDLNDVVVAENSNSVLTGISFDTIRLHKSSRLRLTVYTTQFNYKTGKLIIKDGEFPWKIQVPESSRTEYKLPSHQSPTYNKKENVPDSTTDEFVKLSVSPLRESIGDTVPYIDAQPVLMKKPLAMIGAGLFHKGHSTSSGFIALKLFTYHRV